MTEIKFNKHFLLNSLPDGYTAHDCDMMNVIYSHMISTGKVASVAANDEILDQYIPEKDYDCMKALAEYLRFHNVRN